MLPRSLATLAIFALTLVPFNLAPPLHAAVPPGAPSRIFIASGNHQQTGVVGAILPGPLTVAIADAHGVPTPGAVIDWAITAGGGSLSATSSVTDASGHAATTLHLGRVYTSNTVTATIHGTAKVVQFWATAFPGSAATIAVTGGDKQSGTVALTLPTAFQVTCRDQYGNLARHTQIDWAVKSGAGTLLTTASTTNGGIASNTLTLPTIAGSNTVTATIHGANPVSTFTATATPGPPAAIFASTGNKQLATVSGALPFPFVAIVKDAYGNTKPGAQVDWSTDGEEDALAPTASVTDIHGRTGSTLAFGPDSGTRTAHATIHGTSISQTFTAVRLDAAITMQPSPDPSPQAFQPYFLGLSYHKNKINTSLFSIDDPALTALLKNLGPGVLRIVAEQHAHPVAWNHNGPGLKEGELSVVDLVRLAAFLKAVNWKILYGIAFADNRPTCAPGRTDCAADEAAAVSQIFGSALVGFEIGNEPDQYVKAAYGNPPVPLFPQWSFEDFISPTTVTVAGVPLPSWPVYAAAIRAAVPNAALTGPATGVNWNRLFGTTPQASELSLLTRHYYRGSITLPFDMNRLLTPDPRIPEQFAELQQMAAAAHIPGGYRVAECNSITGYVPGVTDAFGAALWTLDFLFDNAKYHSAGVNFHGGGDPPGSFSPLVDNSVHVWRIGPDYFGLFVYARLMKGGSLLTTQTTPVPATKFSAYAVKQPTGSTDVVLSNKDPDHTLTVSVARPGVTTEARSLLLTAPSLTSTSGFRLGGSPIYIDGRWKPASNPTWPFFGNAAVITIPPGSAQIVHLR